MKNRVTTTIFGLAAAYNLAFGLWAGFFPLHFFTLFDLDPPRYPSLWSCLGMVVGVYGILYAHVAHNPADGKWIVGVGLLGKILGPAGWFVTVARGELPARTFPLILCNDLIWWVPFAWFLLEVRMSERRAARWFIRAHHDRAFR
jgi:hypothetical protein